MIGRRLPRVQRSDGTWDVGEWPSQPGDYVGPVTGYTGDLPAVFFLKPNARDADVSKPARAIQHVVSPPHQFRECADGSLEIRNSLGDAHHGVSDGWHGYLSEGHRWHL